MDRLEFLKKMKTAVLAAGLLMMSTSCAFSGNSGNTVLNGDLKFTQADLSVKPFMEIEIETVADVYYTQTNGDQQDVRLDFSKISDPKFKKQLMENVKVVYRENKMIIGLASRVKGISKLKNNERLRVYVTSPDLVKVSLEGVGSFNANAINSHVFEIDNEGVGNVNVKNLLANKIEITNEGVGNVRIDNMQSDHVDIDNEGVGNVQIALFKGGHLDIDNEGVGKVDAHVDCQSVKATLEGVGNIKLSGVTRQLIKEKDGVGSFKTGDLKVLRP